MSLRVTEYHPSDLTGFLYEGEERKFFDTDVAVRRAIRDRVKRGGRIIVGKVLGEVIFFAGIYPLSSQVGEAWLFLNPPHSKRLLFSVSRAIRREVHFTAERMNLVRLQAGCFPIKGTMRFLEFLGFRLEAVLCKFFEGKIDTLVYSIIWRERCQQ